MKLVAVDLGGTNARFAIAELHADRRPTLGTPRKYRTADHAGLADAWAAFARDERENVAGAHEIGWADIWVGKIAHRQRPVVCRNACCRAVLEVHRNGKGGGVGAIVFGHHRREVQALGLFLRHWRADDARGVTHDEGHLVGRAVNGGNDQVPFVLAAVIVGDDDDFAGFKGADRLDDALLVIAHGEVLIWSGRSGRGLSGYGRE